MLSEKPEGASLPSRSFGVTRRQAVAGFGVSAASASVAGLTPGAIAVLTSAIRPAIESVGSQSGDLLVNSVEANVRRQAANLLAAKEIVAPALASGRVQIAGGVYELKTGRVRLLSEEG